MNEIGKVYKCQFCQDTYELSWDDHDRTHQRFCSGDCQYAGEVLPDYIRNSQGEERQKWVEELEKLKEKKRSN